MNILLTAFEKIKIKYCVICLSLLMFSTVIFGQPHRLEGNFGAGFLTYNLNDNGAYRSVTVQATTTNSNANFLFNNSSGSYNPKWVGSNLDFFRNTNTIHPGGTFIYSSGGWDKDHETSISNGNYYTFNVGEFSSANNDLSILETSYNPVSVTRASQVPSGNEVTPNTNVVIAITTSSTPNENIFVRYTIDNWSSSNLIQATGSGTAWTATIPGQNHPTTVIYYVFSSPYTTSSSPQISHTSADMLTLNLDNNSTLNFSFSTNPALPIKLSLFDVMTINDNNIIIWQTASETQNSHFNIQRSADSKNWQTLGRVEGHGTTLIAQDYTFTDRQPLKGKNYYRLEQVDFNGQREYSKTVSVDMRGEGYASISPNPVKDELWMNLTENNDSIYSVRIFNLQGQLIASQKITQGDVINVSELMAGVYFIKIENELRQEILTERFLKK